MLGDKDNSEKIFIENNDVFADIMNMFIFGGEQVIDPKDLESTKTEYSYLNNLSNETGCLRRDISKIWKSKGIKVSILSIENQTKIDNFMPARVIGYDGMTYIHQLKEMLSSNQNNHTIIRNRCLVPSITIVLNFDKKEWKDHLKLTDLFDKNSKEWKSLSCFVNEYKVNVLNVSCLSEEQLKRFKSKFNLVADFLSNYVQGRPLIFGNADMGTENEYKEILELLEIVTSDKIFAVLKNKYRKGCTMDETLNSWTLDRIKREESIKAEGKVEGRAEYQEKINKLKELLVKTGKENLLFDLVGDPQKIDDYLAQNT